MKHIGPSAAAAMFLVVVLLTERMNANVKIWNYPYNSNVYLGMRGAAALSIAAGGAVSNTSGYVGYFAGASGNVTVSGTGSLWTNRANLYVGKEGAGTLTIGDDGAVSVAQTLTMADLGSSSGTVNLQGGSLTAQSMATGAGTANFNWTGGTLAITGPLGLSLDSGLLGSVVNLGPGKGLSVAADTSVNSGVELAVTGGVFSTDTLSVSTGGRALLQSGTIAIGTNFTVNSGGELEITGQDLVLATLPTIEGNLVLDRTALSVPSMSVGSESGTATMTIRGGGSVSNSTGYIGDNAGTSGVVTVSGSDSVWSTNTDDLYIGRFGTGSLSISQGGSVSNRNGILGRYATGSGQVSVDGAGSTWTNRYNVNVGQFGAGSLSISDGGNVLNGDGRIGIASEGQVTVSGAGSTWANTSQLYVGEFGTGTLKIDNGGAVLNGTGFVAYQPDSAGDVTVSGVGSTWTNRGSLVVGRLGNGTLTIADGGAVRVGENLTVAALATSRLTPG